MVNYLDRTTSEEHASNVNRAPREVNAFEWEGIVEVTEKISMDSESPDGFMAEDP